MNRTIQLCYICRFSCYSEEVFLDSSKKQTMEFLVCSMREKLMKKMREKIMKKMRERVKSKQEAIKLNTYVIQSESIIHSSNVKWVD